MFLYNLGWIVEIFKILVLILLDFPFYREKNCSALGFMFKVWYMEPRKKCRTECLMVKCMKKRKSKPTNFGEKQ